MPNILLVEDDVVQVAAFAHIVRQSGAVSFAVTLIDAIRQIRESHFDLIILDLSLPDSTPKQTITEVQEIHGTIPIIVLTSSSEEEILASVERTRWPIVRKDMPQAMVALRDVIDRTLICSDDGSGKICRVNTEQLTQIVSALENIRSTLASQTRAIAEIVLALQGEPPDISGRKDRVLGILDRLKHLEMIASVGVAWGWKVAAYIGAAIVGGIVSAIGALWSIHAGK